MGSFFILLNFLFLYIMCLQFNISRVVVENWLGNPTATCPQGKVLIPTFVKRKDNHHYFFLIIRKFFIFI